MDIKKLLTVDDYEEAWRLQDARKGWITYRKDVDYFCPADMMGFDRDRVDGGVLGLSATESRLSGFLFAIQPESKEARFKDFPQSPTTKDMLSHETYLLEDAEAGNLWARLREEDRLLYALLVYCLHRQKWAKNWTRMTHEILRQLNKCGLAIGRLRALQRIDPLAIERARDYKGAAAVVPSRLTKTLRFLRAATHDDSAVAPKARAVMETQATEFASFLETYKQRRKARCETIAKSHFDEMAGEFKKLLDEPRGRATLDNLARRVSKTVFVETADELIHVHEISTRKSTLLAGQITCLLFPEERLTGKTKPFDKGYAKNALNEYKYAKQSLART